MENKTNHSLILCEKTLQNLEEKRKSLIQERDHWLTKTLHTYNLLQGLNNDNTRVIVQELSHTLLEREKIKASYIHNIESVNSDIEILDKSCELQTFEDECSKISEQFFQLEKEYDEQKLKNLIKNIEEEHNITLCEYEDELKRLSTLVASYEVNFQKQNIENKLQISSLPIQNLLNEELESQIELDKIKQLYLSTKVNLD